MRLAELSIRRPVFTIVLSIVILLMGTLSIGQLGVREYPSVDPPTISISTGYPGASAEVMQAQITEPLEEAINTVAGIKTLTSVSREGASQISAEFSLDTDLNIAASDVRDQLSRAARNLPADTNPPLLNKADADSSPIFGIAFTSETRTQLELGAYADSLRERLQTVPGVASVDQPAEKRYAMRLWMDPEKLAAYNISPLDVRQAVARENIEVPSGRIEGLAVELPITTLSRLNTAAEFNDLVILRTEDRVVRFSDIGYAVLGAQNERGALKLGSTPIAGLYFRQQPGANQIEIVDELRRRLDLIRKEVPADIEVAVAYDNTQYVRRSLLEMTETILLAFGLVVMVVFVFLREWRTTLIPILAIPVSIVGAFWVMHVAGFSINTLTLLGVVLAIGIVVDDAIVVLENIYTRIEAGMSPVEASIAGTREIFLAVIATTITLTVVFLPLLFIGGQAGRLFREFGVTLAGAVLISAVVALTLTPMLCSRLLRRGQSHGPLFRATEPFFRWLEASYRRGLARFMRRRWLALVVLAAAGALSVLLLSLLPRELAPMEDRGRLWVRASAPEGTSYDFMQRFMDELSMVVNAEIPEATVTMTQVPAQGGRNNPAGAVNNGFVRVFLDEREARTRSQQQIVDDLQFLQRRFTAARINITQEPSITGNSSQPGVRFVIQGATVEALREVLPKFLEVAGSSPAFTFVESDFKFTKPEVRVSIDRDRAQTLGVSAQDVAQTLQAALSGQRVGYFVLEGKQYDVIAQLNRDFRLRPSDLENIPVRTASGVQARLGSLISFSESSSPPELYRYNRYSSATVSGTLASGYTLQEGITAMEEAAGATLDDRFITSLTGTARDFRESSSALGAVFLLAVVLIYLVLAAQFESFVDPFVILLTVPLALAGALAVLWGFGQSLNLFSQIGLIMLVGLVTKNGILIVEFTRQRRADTGRPAFEAVQEAAVARLRPILMTTLATTLGILPIALALGAGSEARVSMGIAVIGGLVSGCALTLYVIPAMYCLLSRAPRGAMLPAMVTGSAGGTSG